MERLTRRAKDGSGNTYLGGNADVCWAGVPAEKRNFCVGCPDLKNRDRAKCGPCLLIDRLADYEGTGLGPEEVATILRRTAEHDKAIEEGRLVELPCKVGDTVYIADHWGGRVQEFKVDCITFDGDHLFCYEDRYSQPITPDIWGKTVFLTRAEAEAALDGGGEDFPPETGDPDVSMTQPDGSPWPF